MELVAVGLEVGVAVAYETIHVIVLPLEGLRELHDDWPRLQEGRQFVSVPVSDWSVTRGCPSGWSGDQIMIRVWLVGRCPRPASLIRVLA